MPLVCVTSSITDEAGHRIRKPPDETTAITNPPQQTGAQPPRRGTHNLRNWMRWALLCICGSMAGCTSLFLHPDRVHYFADRPLETPSEDVWIRTADGRDLHALYLPAQGTPRATVLFLHGNAENLTSHIRVVRWLPAEGYSVLGLDYRGFGRSPGKADVHALHQDAEAALMWLRSRDSKASAPVIVYGQSLGGSVAIRLAAQSNARDMLAAVIADSAFSSYRGIAREKLSQVWLTWPLQWPLSWLISDRQAAIDVVERVSPIPLLLIHGQRDHIVEAHHSERLYAVAREPKTLWLIPEGRHIEALHLEDTRTRFLQFLSEITEPPAVVEHPCSCGLK